jgi:hypothetical protein
MLWRNYAIHIIRGDTAEWIQSGASYTAGSCIREDLAEVARRYWSGDILYPEGKPRGVLEILVIGRITVQDRIPEHMLAKLDSFFGRG